MVLKKYRGYFSTSDGVELFYEYEKKGHENTLVFINGLFQCAFNWYPLKKFLQQDYDILLYDLRGQGKSRIEEQSITFDRLVLDLYELITYLGLNKLNLVGISLGSLIATLFSQNYFNMVNKMVLLSPPGGPRFQMIVDDWKNILELLGDFALFKFIIPWIFSGSFIRRNEEKIQTILDTYVERNELKNLLKMFTVITPYPEFFDILKGISVPYVVVIGKEDALLSLNETMSLMYSLNKNDFLEVIEAAGHSLIEEVPEKVAGIIKKFIRNGV